MSGNTMDIGGGCYCGEIRYRATGVGTALVERHCSQCRKQSGHRYATALTRAADVEIDGAEALAWFRASSAAERGFCAACGSHLFWRSLEDDGMAILAASIDDASAFAIERHIFVDDKGGYYEIDDGPPRFAGYDRPLPPV